ncbi:MAG: hypothetical protein M3Z14_02180 [Candidatus Eremiobacteraeota bacterium]|nr:hypothetical protein [Candidatus Eremiobacteraeota bacterium]
MKNRLVAAILFSSLGWLVAGCSSGTFNSSLPASAPPGNVQADSEAGAMQQVQPANTPVPAVFGTPAPIRIYYGGTVGLDNTFSPVDGDTSAGGHGNSVDGVPCDNSAIPYHFHVHVSLLTNGNRLAVPDGIGLHNPRVEDKHGLIYATICYYHLHTHDATGLIHAEAPAKRTFTLGQLFAVWGQPLSSTNVAGHTGTVKAFTANAPTPGYLKQTGPYRAYTGDLKALQFESHQEIVLEVGPPFIYPPKIPAIIFPTYQ